MINFDPDSNSYSFPCPNCELLVQVRKDEVRCKIFRHGYYKQSMKGIPPHAPKEVCDQLVKEDKIYGCGKPFWFDGKELKKCGYI